MEKDRANGDRTGAHLDLRGAEAKGKVHVIPVANADISQVFTQI